MSKDAYQHLIHLLTDAALPLAKEADTYTTLLKQIGDARFVLIGEATHGTQEFYQARIEITRQLIQKKGFMAVAIEGDWPDAYCIHRYVQGKGLDEMQALDEFTRFPTWMWRNTTIPPFLKWLRQHNDQLATEDKVGFYGLDLYSLNASMHAVIDYLTKVDPEGAKRAKERYACLDHVDLDPQTYGYLTVMGIKKSCMQETIAQLVEMQHKAIEYLQNDGISAEDEYFFATQNARLIKNAEKYYRTMFEEDVVSWNVRDQHMSETLNILAEHLEKRSGKPAKIVVWAHNSHVGDAGATEMSERGEFNLGQLVREQHGENSYLIGFSTYEGFVTAASEWDMPAECKRVLPALAGSCEELFLNVDHESFLLNLRNPEIEKYLAIPRLQRAIGVIYLPQSERDSHYFFTRLPYQFDSIIHFDHSTAVRPLDMTEEWKQGMNSNSKDKVED